MPFEWYLHVAHYRQSHIFKLMIKSLTNFVTIFFIFWQLQSQITQIDINGYHPFCDETFHILVQRLVGLDTIRELVHISTYLPLWVMYVWNCPWSKSPYYHILSKTNWKRGGKKRKKKKYHFGGKEMKGGAKINRYIRKLLVKQLLGGGGDHITVGDD